MADEQPTDRKSLMESLAAKLAAGPPAKPVGLVKQVDHTAAETGVGSEASLAEKALGGVLTGSLAGQSAAGGADKEAATAEDQGQPREALFADLAAKLAAGPPTQPVGLVKQQEGPWEPAAGEAGEAEKKLGGLLKESLSPKGDDK
ncbi:hypothetical protein I4F81_006970 [Pyropia yezoensis]|uniref:Uncharacterized protein n=2 Tax=Pyropia yezoensis TaxID=2788 RepID=A0ACC3C2P7_PYRYE|nr:hypothetical protein I4F81_006970 [Neopyropia yezoensis]